CRGFPIPGGDGAGRIPRQRGPQVGRICLNPPEALPRGVARHPPAGAVVDAVAAEMCLVGGPEDEARVAVAARDENRMSRLRVVVAGREGTSGALAVDVDPAELRVMLALNKVVADFVDQRKWFTEDILESHRDLLEHGEPVHDGEVPAGRDGIQIVAIVRRLGGEVAEVERLDGRVLFSGKL